MKVSLESPPNNSPADLMAFVLQQDGVEYRDEPFPLRAGGESNWYVDCRAGLARGRHLKLAGRLMLSGAQSQGWKFEIVSGMGIAGSALMDAVVLVAYDSDLELSFAQGNDNKSPDQRYGYGLHGAKVKGKDVLVVDDTASTGDSLLTLIGMVEKDGGRVSGVETLVDRSEGRVAKLMAEQGYKYSSVLTFHETGGLLIQSQ